MPSEETSKAEKAALSPSPEHALAAAPSVPLQTTENTPASTRIAKTADAPVKAVDIIVVIIAQKLKKAVKDVPTSSTIKALVGGTNY